MRESPEQSNNNNQESARPEDKILKLTYEPNLNAPKPELETPEKAVKRAANEQVELQSAKEELEQKFNEIEPNPDSNDYYVRLGLSQDAYEEDVKTAYFRAAKRYKSAFDETPDKDAVKNFKKIKEAFDCLSDKEKRVLYDDSRQGADELVRASKGSQTDVVPYSEGKGNVARIVNEAELALKDNLPAVIQRFEDKGALTEFIYKIEAQSGELEHLTGDLKRDSQKIYEFFDGYGIPMDENKIKSLGASLYEGALKRKNKREGLLFFMFKLLLGEDIMKFYQMGRVGKE